jgi:hypothetical protein
LAGQVKDFIIEEDRHAHMISRLNRDRRSERVKRVTRNVPWSVERAPSVLPLSVKHFVEYRLEQFLAPAGGQSAVFQRLT